MDDTRLRSALIRLAHAQPELRPTLLPLLRTAAEGKPPRRQLGTCVGCGNRVPDRDQYPWPGHKKNCPLVKEWRSQHEKKHGNPEGKKTAGVLNDEDNPFGLYPGHEAVTEAIDAEITQTAVAVASAHNAIERLINANAKLGASDTDSRQRIWAAWFTAIKAAMNGRT